MDTYPIFPPDICEMFSVLESDRSFLRIRQFNRQKYNDLCFVKLNGTTYQSFNKRFVTLFENVQCLCLVCWLLRLSYFQGCC